jgi:shikimate kinase
MATRAHAEAFSVILKLKRTPGIYLVGFMGSGKSTVGRSLADELGWGFADIDQDIEADERISITEIFDRLGEHEFRRLESAAVLRRVQDIRRGKPMVVALGGGAYTIESNLEMLDENGVTVWLDCQFELIRRRIERETHRPLARDPERLIQLFEQRIPVYQRADFRIFIDTDDTSAAVASILKLPIF